MKADIIIIGGGVVGSCISRELSQYDVDIVLLEKSADVPSGASKANTAILHAGFDPKPGTLKALLNVQGNALYDELAKDLDVPVKRIGSLVVAFDDAEIEALEELIAGTGLDMVQLRNLNIDPDPLFGLLNSSSGEAVGIRIFIERLRRDFPALVIGNFSRPLQA